MLIWDFHLIEPFFELTKSGAKGEGNTRTLLNYVCLLIRASLLPCFPLMMMNGKLS